MPKTYSFMPDANQELLLKATLQDGNAAIESWNKWRRGIALDDVELGSQRLLPFLLHRLQIMGVDDPELRRYQSVARYVWLQNHKILWRAQQLISQFAAAGITAMPLKGLAIGPLYYSDLRLRAMSDCDLLIPCASVRDASDILVRNGWRSPNEASLRADAYLSTCHAATYFGPDRFEIDLHWHLCSDCCSNEADAVFWADLQPLSFNEVETRTLSATGHLFHTCVHGGRQNELAPIRWIVDSAQIIREGQIDWHKILDLAREFRLVRRLQQTLGVLHGTFSLPIPDGVVAELMALKPSAIELVEEHTARSRAPRPIKSSIRRYCYYHRNIAGRPGDDGILHYLQAALGTPTLKETLFRISRSFSDD
jgi:hypothetical protein